MKKEVISLVLVVLLFTILVLTTTTNVYGDKKKDKDDEYGLDDLTEKDIETLCGPYDAYQEHEETCKKIRDLLEEGIIKDDPNNPDFEWD
jgi:hypothetical protein